jgi:hypothetical protein
MARCTRKGKEKQRAMFERIQFNTMQRQGDRQPHGDR